VVSGDLDNKRGGLIFCSAAQRFSEVHVNTGATGDGARFVTGDGAGRGGGTLVGVIGGGFRTGGFSGTGTGRLVPAQSVGSGSWGTVVQPATRKSAPQKIRTADLNTRQLCGTAFRTQAVLTFSWPAHAACPFAAARS